MARSVMRWEVVDDVMLSFATAGPIDDKVWHAFVKDMDEKNYTRQIAAGTGMVEVTSVQRKLAADVFKKRNIPVIVITNEKLVRGIVTAVSWMGVNIKAFAWDDVNEGMRHIGVPPALKDHVFSRIMALRHFCESEAAGRV